MARMAIADRPVARPNGNIAVHVRRVSSRCASRRCAAAQPISRARSLRQPALPPARIVHHVGAVEGRAQHGGVRDLAAIAAADAGLSIAATGSSRSGSSGSLHRQRRAAGQADAGVVAGADVLIDAEARLRRTRSPRLTAAAKQRLLAALPVEHAFGRRDDDLRPLRLRGQRLAQRVAHLRHRRCGRCAAPRSRRRRAPPPRSGAWCSATGCRRATTGCPARRSRRNSSCRPRQHDAVVLVEDGVGDAAGQAVVPEPAVAHDRDRPLLRRHLERRRRATRRGRSPSSWRRCRTAAGSRTGGSRCRR